MAQRVGDKVKVNGEECEIVRVHGAGSRYQVKTPSGKVKPIDPDQIGTEAQEEKPDKEPDKEPDPEPEPEGNGSEGEGGTETTVTPPPEISI